MKWIRRSAYGLFLLTWLALIALWIQSYWFVAIFEARPRHWLDHARYVESHRGSITLRYVYSPLPPYAHYRFHCVPVLKTGFPFRFWMRLFHVSGFAAKSFESGSITTRPGISIVFPHWAPAAAMLPFLLIPPVRSWRRRRTRPGTCSKCGYDLTGNVSGRCPECGEVVPVASALRSQ